MAKYTSEGIQNVYKSTSEEIFYIGFKFYFKDGSFRNITSQKWHF
jgi:hypothetical protein